MGIVITGEPAAEPISAAEVKANSRIDIADEDTLITALITAARQMAEIMTRRVFITQTWKLTLDSFPGSYAAVSETIYAGGSLIYLPNPCLQSITTIKYYDSDGVLQTLDAGDYQVDTVAEPGRVLPAPSLIWPSTQLWKVNAVEITFVAGYGTAGSDVPGGIKQALLMMVGHWFEHREAVSELTLKDVPMAARALLYNYSTPGV